MNEDFFTGSAFKNNNGKWTYVFANATNSIKTVAINNNKLPEGTFDIYRYEESSLPEDDSMIDTQENIEMKNNKLFVDIKSNTVVLCQQND